MDEEAILARAEEIQARRATQQSAATGARSPPGLASPGRTPRVGGAASPIPRAPRAAAVAAAAAIARPRPAFARARTVDIADVFTFDDDFVTVTFTNQPEVAARHFAKCKQGCDKCAPILELAGRVRESYDVDFISIDIGSSDFKHFKKSWATSAVSPQRR